MIMSIKIFVYCLLLTPVAAQYPDGFWPGQQCTFTNFLSSAIPSLEPSFAEPYFSIASLVFPKKSSIFYFQRLPVSFHFVLSVSILLLHKDW